MLSAEQRVVTNVSEWVSFPDCRSRARGACCRERREASQHFIDKCSVKIVFCVSVSLRRAVSYNQVKWASVIPCLKKPGAAAGRGERRDSGGLQSVSPSLASRPPLRRPPTWEMSAPAGWSPSGCPCLTSPAPPSGRVTWVLTGESNSVTVETAYTHIHAEVTGKILSFVYHCFTLFLFTSANGANSGRAIVKLEIW